MLDESGEFKDFNVVTNIPEWVRSEKIQRREFLIKSGAYKAARKKLDDATEAFMKRFDELGRKLDELENSMSNSKPKTRSTVKKDGDGE